MPVSEATKRKIVKIDYPSVRALKADMRGNFPRGGLFIPTDTELSIGQRVTLQLRQPGALQPIEIAALVVGGSDRGVDMRFDVVDPEEQATIRSLIEGAAEAIPPPAAGERVNILLVEPNAKLRAMFKQGILASARRAYGLENFYCVTDVGSGEMARSQLQCNLFSMMVTELHLPKMDGLDLIRMTRSIQPGLPICLMCSPRPGDETEALAAGANYFRRKPIQRDALFQTLRGALDPDAKAA